MEGYFSITALNIYNNTITYSRSLDYYQFRVLKYEQETIALSGMKWKEAK
jgi:hypothetical protein